MIAVDTNILVYSHRADSSFYQSASLSLQQLAESGKDWAIPWPCIHEFIAIVTHPRIYKPSTPIDHAVEQVECWLECPNLHLIGETETGYWDKLQVTLKQSKITGAHVHDARVASICLTHGIDELWSADRDFSRFPSLKVVNPLL